MNKFVTISDQRVLARTVVYDGGIRKLALIDQSGDTLSVTDFDLETANTVFVDGIVVCMRRQMEHSEDPFAILRFVMSRVRDMNPSSIAFELVSEKALASVGDASVDIILVKLQA